MSRAENLAVLRRVAGEMGASSELVSYLSAIMHHESGGDRYARNSRSSATGLFQFIDSTWAAYGQGGDIYNTEDQCRAAIRFARDNAETLRSILGREPTAGEYYLAHFAGPEGARRVLEADPDTPIRDLLGNAVIEANRPIRMRGKHFEDFTAEDLRNWANGVMHGSSYRDARAAGNQEEADRYARQFLRDVQFSDDEISTMFTQLGEAIASLINTILDAMMPPELAAAQGRERDPSQTDPAMLYVPPLQRDEPGRQRT